MHLDHVAYAWDDLDTVVDAFERVGFSPEYGGTHATGTTHMSLVTFPDGSYLELLSTTPGTDPDDAGFWPDRIAASAGPAAWCIGVDDVRAWAKQCIDAGLAVDGPKTTGREREDGRHVEWDTAFVGGEAERDLHPFAISDRTPRGFRVPAVDEPSRPGTLTGVAEVVLAVPNLGRAVETFRRRYRLPTPTRWTDEAFGARLASFPGKPVTLAEPNDERSWLAGRLDGVGPGPCVYLLDTDDLDAARDEYELSSPTVWGTREGTGTGGRRLAWVDSELLGTTVGVVANDE
jgi:hypothetical protein